MRANLAIKIIRESAGILILASLISSAGGVGLEVISSKLVLLLPLLIALPSLNDMIGDFGTIVAAKFTSALYLGRIRERGWSRSKFVRGLFATIGSVAAFSAIYLVALATIIALVKGWIFESGLFVRLLAIIFTSTASLVTIICFVCVVGGFYVYRRGHDPDNYLIPIATAVADMGNLAVLAALVWLLF